MIPDLLWIIGFYVAAAAFTHGVYGRGAGARKRHYVLVAGNEQMQIEGYMRALQRFSRRTGTDIGITVVLENSSDETGPIVEKFLRVSDAIGLIRGDSEEGTEARERVRQQWESAEPYEAGRDVVWVELGKREDLSRLPL